MTEARRKVVRLIYEAEPGLPAYSGPGLLVAPGRWEEEIGPFTTDENTWTIGRNAAELHVAGWLYRLAGSPVKGLDLAVAVSVEGLAHKHPHPHGSYVWQAKGAALVTASGLPDPRALLDTHLADYRTEEGRIRRTRSKSSTRAAAIAQAMEAGVHPRDAILAFRPPPVVHTSSGPVDFWPRVEE